MEQCSVYGVCLYSESRFTLSKESSLSLSIEQTLVAEGLNYLRYLHFLMSDLYLVVYLQDTLHFIRGNAEEIAVPLP